MRNVAAVNRSTSADRFGKPAAGVWYVAACKEMRMNSENEAAGAPYFYEPRNGHGLAHNPLNSIIAPRPIGWVSTLGNEGVANLAPYSFFNLFNYDPPIVGFSSMGWKDSAENARTSGEFVWNLVTMELAEQMNASSAAVGAAIDEFALAGLAKAPSRIVAPPRVAASPVQFECKVTQIIRLQSKDGVELDQWLILGEAVGIHIDAALLEDGVFKTVKARPVSRGGGPRDYFGISENDRFEMQRPG
jgi:flavin reductase (DIM6/NTAB) family NADH-FMN oxidoreductase RutF